MIMMSRKPRKSGSSGRVSVRDRLLPAEVQELEAELPPTCRADWPDPDRLSVFNLTVAPDEGFWRGGVFRFTINVTEDYNMTPPKVKCLTKLFHPNISEDGDICLSILRETSIDKMGWAPTRRLKDVAWGLNSLFTDLLNFDDPLNVAAAELYQKDRLEFQNRVKEYLDKYARR